MEKVHQRAELGDKARGMDRVDSSGRRIQDTEKEARGATKALPVKILKPTDPLDAENGDGSTPDGIVPGQAKLEDDGQTTLSEADENRDDPKLANAQDEAEIKAAYDAVIEEAKEGTLTDKGNPRKKAVEAKLGREIDQATFLGLTNG